MKKIVTGTRLKDGWGNIWFVVNQDEKGYNLCNTFNYKTQHFTAKEIKNNFILLNRQLQSRIVRPLTLAR